MHGDRKKAIEIDMIILLASVRESEYAYVTMEQTRKEVTKMGKYKLIVRLQGLMGWPATDFNRKALDCYKETPVFYANSNLENIEIVDAGKALLGNRIKYELHN